MSKTEFVQRAMIALRATPYPSPSGTVFLAERTAAQARRQAEELWEEFRTHRDQVDPIL